MNLAVCVLTVSGILGADPASTDATDADAAVRTQWRQLFDGVAGDYKLVGSDRQPLKLVDPAVYTWARAGDEGGTYGSVYVWTSRGNAEAVACFWRYVRGDGKQSIVHELHSLSPVVLRSEGKGSDAWKPKAGLKRHLLDSAPPPAKTQAGRMQQMRTFCRDFSARSVSSAGERTELRLLPQPLYRFQSSNADVLDGALFAFVCSVGTDPEVFLQLEAAETPAGPRWHYSVGRFSHMDLFVDYKGTEVWQALRDQDNPISHNAEHTYFVFHQPFDPKLLGAPKDEQARE
jgi:hypothetical protein